MDIEKFRQWAQDARLFLEHFGTLNPAMPQTKQGIFDAVLAELAMWHEYEWGPLGQADVDIYQEIRKQFMGAVE